MDNETRKRLLETLQIQPSEIFYPTKYDGYWASPEGQIFSTKTNKILKQYKSGRGYYTVTLRIPGAPNNKKTVDVHRIIAETFVPNIMKKIQVNHKNGRKLDNRAVNLEWCTAEENREHARRMGKYRGNKPCPYKNLGPEV